MATRQDSDLRQLSGNLEVVPASRPAFLVGGGACADLIFARDWTATPLGPIEDWSPSLKTAIAILLRSPVPIVMLWGPDGVMLYNDAYSAFAGGRHPSLLGSVVCDGWQRSPISTRT